MKALILPLICLTILSACQQQSANPPADNSQTTSSTATATIIISVTAEDYLDENVVKITEDANLLELMQSHYTIKEDNDFITAIEDYEQDPALNRYWLYEVNGEFAEVGAADFIPADGDTIEWTLSSLE